MTQLQKAKEIAEKAHTNQKRKNDEPYINHPLRVAKKVSCLGTNAKIVALLHDVVEDSDYTLDMLKDEGFNDEIINDVYYLTRNKTESYLTYILAIKNLGSYTARQVKTADLLDNLNGATGTLKDKYEMALYILAEKVECK